MARILRARDFGNVVTLSSDEGKARGKGDPVQKLLISYFYITKSILISQNALDFVISHIRFCDIKNRICYSKNQAHFVTSKNRFCDIKTNMISKILIL